MINKTYLVYLWQILHLGPMQHPQRQADHLQILAARRGRDVPRFGAHVVDDGFLQPGDQEVRAFVHDALLDSGEPVEDHGSCAAFDVVHGGLGQGTADGDWDGPFVDCGEGVGHGGGIEGVWFLEPVEGGSAAGEHCRCL